MSKQFLNKEELRIRYNELIENPVARVPICICICADAGIQGTNQVKLNQGLNTLLKSLQENENTVDSAEICIVTAGNGSCTLVNDFETTDKIKSIQVEGKGKAPLSDAIELGLDKLEIRIKEYKETGTDYFQPWIIIICAGTQEQDLTPAARRIQEKLSERRINSVPVAVDNGARKYISCLGERGKVYALNNMQYDAFFKWVGKSAESMSESLSGAMKTEIPTDSWESLF